MTQSVSSSAWLSQHRQLAQRRPHLLNSLVQLLNIANYQELLAAHCHHNHHNRRNQFQKNIHPSRILILNRDRLLSRHSNPVIIIDTKISATAEPMIGLTSPNRFSMNPDLVLALHQQSGLLLFVHYLIQPQSTEFPLQLAPNRLRLDLYLLQGFPN